MGARVNFIFKQSDGNAVGLYSHWGEDSWAEDLAMALKHAAKRKGDESYAARIIISQLINNQWDQETGFGLWASSEDGMYGGDCPDITINLVNQTVVDETGTHTFDSFISYHALSLNGQA